MAVRIERVNNNLHILQRYGYILDDEINIIVAYARKHDFKCLFFLQACDNLFLNSQQLLQLKSEYESLYEGGIITDVQYHAMQDCFVDVLASERQFFACIGD